ncbi:MAG: carbamoyltransferase family protein, partial [Myxococcales bacterium]
MSGREPAGRRRILGISAHYHDSAAALLVDGQPAAAVQEERLSRRKNDAAFPLAAIEWCLDSAGLSPEDLDAVVFYEKPMLKFERIVTMALRGFPRTWRSFPRAMRSALGGKLWVKGIIASQLGVRGDRILFAEHHRSHAAMAFLGSPSRAAAILTADGVGEWATLSLGRGTVSAGGAANIELLRELRFPHSLGLLYSAFTAYLGFPVNEGEYKVMGLAAYGKPAHADLVRRIARRTADGGVALDPSWFDFQGDARQSYSRKLCDALGPARDPWERIDPGSADGARWADVAASVQCVLEEILVDLARALQRETGLRDLCLGGGVALNGVANARILREAGFENVYVPSAPGDGGCALGAALLADRIHFAQPHR